MPCLRPRRRWGFWVNDAGSSPVDMGKPHSLTLTADSGRSLTVTVADFSKARDLGVQFR
jgi:acetolactate synthase regulatory subunit